MTSKVSPKIYRIGKTKKWESKGFYESNFASFLEEDFEIRKFLNESLRTVGVEKIIIERSFDEIGILIYSSRPGLIIGRGGEGVKKLKEGLEKKMNSISEENKEKKIRIEIREVKNPWLSAPLVAQDVARQIEKRLPYRRVVKQAIHKIMINKEVKGVRIQVKGRLNGVEIARGEHFQEGQLKRMTIRGKLEYGFELARCSYGVIGVKVLIYKGEEF
jgi:small subunit ribosomal protein S3